MFEQAVRLDPNYAKAIANLGMTYLDDIWGDWTEARDQYLRQAEELARRATEVDPFEPLGYVVLGLTYFLESRYDQAVSLLDKARALNPNDDHIIHAQGWVLATSGRSPEMAITLLKEMQQRNPYYPEVIQRDLALAYLYAHRYEDGLAALNQVARRHRPSYWLYKAANHGQLGQLEEARAAIDEGLRLKPDLNLEHAIERRLKMGLSPENAELLREALRTAGLPERAPAGSHESDPWPLPAEPSIAVLPFENLSGDPTQAYFADGVTNDIITDLSKFSTLFVTASNASFRYRDRAVRVQDVARDLGVR
jgi:adenylate cyclase